MLNLMIAVKISKKGKQLLIMKTRIKELKAKDNLTQY